MHDLKWSESEKKLSRRLFEAALASELTEVLAEFKAKAAAVTTPEEMWVVQSYLLLAQKQREIDEKYNYRYSQLIVLLGRLIREGRLKEEQLHGLSEEKLSYIQRILLL